MDLFQISFFTFIFGLCFGSFFNVVVTRLYAMESLDGRSRCPQCRRTLAWFDLIPVFSWMFLNGQCRYCKKPISIQYPLIELLTAFIFSILIYRHGIAYGCVGMFSGVALMKIIMQFIIASTLIIVIASDARYQLIYDIVLLPTGIVVLILLLLTGAKLTDMLFAVLMALVFFGLQYAGSKGKYLGFGDVKLGVFLGIAFGWKVFLFLLGLAYILGSVVGIYLLLSKRKKMTSTLPLGVFLGIAGLYLLLYGSRPLERLLHL